MFHGAFIRARAYISIRFAMMRRHYFL